MTALLDVQALSAGYGRAEVLAELSLRVLAGQVVTVIGPNGAGKSTLLGSLMGVLPARGGVVFDGRALGPLSLEQRVMQGLVLVPEKRELFSSMSVEDNLLLGGFRPRRLGQRDWREGLAQVYELFPRLRERARQQAGTLSGGERQMLALGRALMARPRLLMLDEPSLGLAPLVVQEIFRVLAQLRAQGMSILLVEQNARAALALADEGHVLEAGRFVLQGPAEQLAQDERLVQSYLGGGPGR